MSGREGSGCAINVMVPPQSKFCTKTDTFFPMYGDLRIGPVQCLLLALWQSETADLAGCRYKRRGKHKSLPLTFMYK